jgi:hypothetical protein
MADMDIMWSEVEADVMVVATRCDKRRAASVTLRQLEAEYAAVKTEGAVEVGNLQVDVADPHTGIDWAFRSGRCVVLLRHFRTFEDRVSVLMSPLASSVSVRK